MDWRSFAQRLAVDLIQAGLIAFVFLVIGFEIGRIVKTIFDKSWREEIALGWLAEVAAETWEFVRGFLSWRG